MRTLSLILAPFDQIPAASFELVSLTLSWQHVLLFNHHSKMVPQPRANHYNPRPWWTYHSLTWAPLGFQFIRAFPWISQLVNTCIFSLPRTDYVSFRNLYVLELTDSCTVFIAPWQCRASVLTTLIWTIRAPVVSLLSMFFELVSVVVRVCGLSTPASIFGVANRDWSVVSKNLDWSPCDRRFFSIMFLWR